MALIGIVIVTHGSLAHALLESAEMIVGRQQNVHAIALSADDNLDTLRERVSRTIPLANAGKGVLVLVDMYGGTPANAVALGQCLDGQQCLCGVNLPMLLEALTQREFKSLDELARGVAAVGCDSVVDLGAAVDCALRANIGPWQQPSERRAEEPER
jgi:PTS system mannose-specific IIA component